MMDYYIAIKSHVGRENSAPWGDNQGILRLQNHVSDCLQMVRGGGEVNVGSVEPYIEIITERKPKC